MNSGSLSVSDPKVQEAELKYGEQPKGPGASAENPAGVFPQVAPEPAQASHQPAADQPITQSGAIQAGGDVPGTEGPTGTAMDPRLTFSDPMAFSELMTKLDHSLTEAINAIEDESGSGLSNVGRALQEKFKGWREEVNDMRKGKPMAPHSEHVHAIADSSSTAEPSGLFAD